MFGRSLYRGTSDMVLGVGLSSRSICLDPVLT
jgi:hypothetical protein